MTTRAFFKVWFVQCNCWKKIYPEPRNYSFVSISCSKSPVQSSQNLKHKFLYWKWPLPPLELFQIFIWFGPTIRPSASFSFHHLFWYFVSYQCTNSDKKPEQDNVKKSFFWWYDVVRHVSIPISHGHTSAHSFVHYHHFLEFFLQNLNILKQFICL